jgi:hypothetical protein
VISEYSDHQVGADDAVDLFLRRWGDRFYFQAFAFPYSSIAQLLNNKQLCKSRNFSIARNRRGGSYSESDNKPMSGIRSHVGRLFNS